MDASRGRESDSAFASSNPVDGRFRPCRSLLPLWQGQGPGQGQSRGKVEHCLVETSRYPAASAYALIGYYERGENEFQARTRRCEQAALAAETALLFAMQGTAAANFFGIFLTMGPAVDYHVQKAILEKLVDMVKRPAFQDDGLGGAWGGELPPLHEDAPGGVRVRPLVLVAPSKDTSYRVPATARPGPAAGFGWGDSLHAPAFVIDISMRGTRAPYGFATLLVDDETVACEGGMRRRANVVLVPPEI